MTDQPDWTIVLRTRHDGNVVGYYRSFDSRSRWTTDPKSAHRFKGRMYAEAELHRVLAADPTKTDVTSVELVP